MRLLVCITGLAIIAESLFFLVKVDFLRKTIDFFSKNKRYYIAALIRLVIGIIFLISTMQTQIKWLMVILGLAASAGGILMFIMPGEKIRAIFAYFHGKSSVVLRLLCLLGMVIGGLIIYAAGMPE